MPTKARIEIKLVRPNGHRSEVKTKNPPTPEAIAMTESFINYLSFGRWTHKMTYQASDIVEVRSGHHLRHVRVELRSDNIGDVDAESAEPGFQGTIVWEPVEAWAPGDSAWGYDRNITRINPTPPPGGYPHEELVRGRTIGPAEVAASLARPL
jgi:hypothetical protein